MNPPDYRYVIDLTRSDGSALGHYPADVDWTPVLEWGRLLALRRWREAEMAAGAAVSVAPAWHAESGAPCVGGLRVRVAANGCAPVTDEIPLAYFRPLAVKLSHTLVEQKKLAAGDRFHYSVAAFPQPSAPRHPSGEELDFEDVPVPVALGQASLAEFRARSSVLGDLHEGDLAVFVPQQVVSELIERTEQAGALEAGAMLLGRLHAAAEAEDVFLEVTAQVPALHTVAETARLSLTADTWNAVNAARALRRGHEQLVGWQHSHPAKFWCDKACSTEARARCALGRPFFSSDDCAVHRTVFWKAHSVALLITNAPAEMNVAMFAWHRGLIRSRGFFLLDPNPAARPLAVPATAPTTGEHTHETTCQ